MRSFPCVVGSILLVATATVTAPARSQPVASSAESSQKADDLFHKGKSLYQAARVREAYEAYAGAWALKRSYDIAANMANTEMVLGMKRDAAEHLVYCSRNFPPSGNKAQLDAIKARFEEVRKEVGAVVVKGFAADATLRIDGRDVGPGPFADELYVEPGKHTIEVKRAGYEDARQAFDVKAGGLSIVEVMQKKIALSLSPAPERRAPIVPLPRVPSGPSLPLVVGGASLSLIALGTGAALFAVAGGKATDADQMVADLKSASAPFCPKSSTTGACGDLFSLRQDQGTFHNAGVALLVGGGAGAAGILTYALWPRGKRAATEAQIVPVVSTSGGGMWLRGTF